MLRRLTQVLLVLFAMAGFCSIASADSIAIGDLSFDEGTLSTSTSTTFDITNLTGGDAFPPSFPVTSLLTITVTNVVVDLEGGGTVTLPGSDFAVVDAGGDVDCVNTASAASGGCDLAGDTVIGATLTGTLSPTTGLSGLPAGDTGIEASFTTTMSPSCDPAAVVLVAGCDTSIIYATGVTGVTAAPEPGTWGLLGLGLIGLLIGRKRLRTA